MVCWNRTFVLERHKRSYTFNVRAWKALQSVAIVTGYEVPGLSMREWGAWKALRLWRCLSCKSCGVVPSRHIVHYALIRALRTRLLSLRSVVPSRHLTHNFTLALHKRSFYLPTNFTNFRASEHRAEFIRNLPSAAENIELVKIRATYKVAIIWTLCYSCIFVKFVGK